MTTAILPDRSSQVPAFPKAPKASKTKKSKRLDCSYCRSSFRSKVSFYRHFCSKRQRNFLKCSDCSEKVVGEKKLIRHLLKHVGQATTLKFKHRKNFEDWRRSEQKKLFTSFSHLKNKESSYFSCRFDKRCHSRIMAVFKKKSVFVKYSVHDHPFSLKNVNYDQFSKMTVNYIKDIISEGMPVVHLNEVLSGTTYGYSDSQMTRNYLTSTFIGDLSPSKFCHREALMLKSVSKISENLWTVKTLNGTHTVEQIELKCERTDCTRCPYTICQDLCTHLFRCSCRNDLCDHIHKIRSINFQSGQVILNRDDLELFGFIVKQCYAMPQSYQFVFDFKEPKISTEVSTEYRYDCDVGDILHSFKDYEDDNRNTGKQLLTKVVLAYMEADPKVLPDVNNLLRQILETCVSKNHLPIKQFTPNLKNCDEKQLTRPLFKIGCSTINMLSLKSLDYGISDQEIKVLRKADSCFTKGWIYDSIIDGFIERILDKDFSFLSSAVAQLVFSSNCSDEVVFEKDKCILIPYNYDGCHWILLNVDMKMKDISLYDPSSTMPQAQNVIKNLLNHIKTNTEKDFKEEDWTVTTPVHSRQKDDFNCGVFICWYCERLMKKLNLVDNVNPFEYREKIYSIIVGDYQINNWLQKD